MHDHVGVAQAERLRPGRLFLVDCNGLPPIPQRTRNGWGIR